MYTVAVPALTDTMRVRQAERKGSALSHSVAAAQVRPGHRDSARRPELAHRGIPERRSCGKIRLASANPCREDAIMPRLIALLFALGLLSFCATCTATSSPVMTAARAG
jgi:hypothetical protein